MNIDITAAGCCVALSTMKTNSRQRRISIPHTSVSLLLVEDRKSSWATIVVLVVMFVNEAVL